MRMVHSMRLCRIGLMFAARTSDRLFLKCPIDFVLGAFAMSFFVVVLANRLRH
jgi:hypothetical protein